MRRITTSDYLAYVGSGRERVIAGTRVKFEPIRVERWEPTSDEIPDTVYTTVWSFPERGRWATHGNEYRGNWPPQVPRLLIERFTEPGALVLDPTVGGGTSCIEAAILGRRCIGVDVSRDAAMLAFHKMYWLSRAAEEAGRKIGQWEIYVGDARRLTALASESVDLVLVHPPYWNIIKYTDPPAPGDMSRARSLSEYLLMVRQAIGEAVRVLKRGGVLAVMIGDLRRQYTYIPLSHYVLDLLDKRRDLDLLEEVIKVQHRTRKTSNYWLRRKTSFLLIAHEKIFVARKR